MSNLVQIAGTQVRVNANTLSEAKLAIKELRLKKKEYSLQKKAITEQEKMIRSQYTAEVRSRGSKMSGGGGLGKLVRAIQTASRDNRRAQLAKDLAPYERKKQEIESMMHAIDSVIIQVEAAILKGGG
ncbi:MAG: hypothetical protein ACOZAQ_07155 [Pseudomonadota bacterium]